MLNYWLDLLKLFLKQTCIRIDWDWINKSQKHSHYRHVTYTAIRKTGLKHQWYEKLNENQKHPIVWLEN